MNILKLFFMYACITNITLLHSMADTSGETKNVVAPVISSLDQTVLPKTCAWATEKHRSQTYAVTLWCQSIAKILIPAQNNPEGLYKGLEEIFVTVGQEALRNHPVTPEFVARCINELDIDVTQLIYVRISETSYGGYSLLNKALVLEHAEITETLRLVLASPKSFLPGVFYNGRRISKLDTPTG